MVVGAAGWGKSTAVGSWARRRRTAWVRNTGHLGNDHAQFAKALQVALQTQAPPQLVGVPEPSPAVGYGATYSAALCAWLRDSLHEDLVLVVDDLHDLSPDSDPVDLLEGLCRDAPDRLRIVLISRRECPFSLTRLRGQGEVAEVFAPELALDAAEIASKVRAELGEDPDALPEHLHERTAGWPAAVRVALDTLRTTPPDQRLNLLDRLTRPGELLHTYLAEEVLGREPEQVRELLSRLAVLGEASAASVTALGSDGARLLPDLTRRGLVQWIPGHVDHWSVIRPLRDLYEHEPQQAPDERSRLHRIAAQECVERGAHADALRHLLQAGDHAGCAALLVDHGGTLVKSGRLDVVLDVAEAAGDELTDPRIQQVIGQARQVRGQWDAALECLRRAGRDEDPLHPALAWQVGMIAYAQGEFTDVLAVRDRARLTGIDSSAEARLHALTATACRMQGNHRRCRAEAELAVTAARRSGDPSAHAAAFTVLAVLATGSGDLLRADQNCVNALEAARAGGDVLQELRMQVIRAVNLVELGMARDGLAAAEAALQLAESCGEAFLIALALVARARANTRLGALERAFADFAAARDRLQRIGSRFLAWALWGLGDLYRLRGQLARARAAYEETLALAEPSHDVLAVSSGLVGLARIRAADDVAAAYDLADRAVALDEELRRVQALLSRGWVALTAGNRAAAEADAVLAAAVARSRRDGPGLADALTLAVLSASDPARHGDRIAEAIQIWDEAGHRVEAAMGRVVADRIGAPVPDLRADLAQRTLEECGVDVESRRVAGPLAVVVGSPPALSIRSLGVFQVLRDGAPIPPSAWQSRKARDLLKVLVARRRPVAREHLMELLWPETNPVKSGGRLSGLLSILRDVLRSPHTAEAGPVVTEGSVVRLDLTRVSVDVEQVFAHSTSALEAHRRDDPTALERLTAAEVEHTGGFLEEDPQEWAAPLAEEVRALHIALLRALSSRLRATGDADGAVRRTLQLLQHDSYDEPAHLDLIRTHLDAGHHGEAQRCYGLYVGRMNELGVPPSPFPTAS